MRKGSVLHADTLEGCTPPARGPSIVTARRPHEDRRRPCRPVSNQREIKMTENQAVQILEAKVERLTQQLGVMEDIHAVRCLHFIYGYYIDMCLYDEACDLFADDGAVRFLNGLYKGRAGVRRLYCDWFRKTFTKGHNGPVYGFLLDHLQMPGLVTVAPDRRSARARFRAL